MVRKFLWPAITARRVGSSASCHTSCRRERLLSYRAATHPAPRPPRRPTAPPLPVAPACKPIRPPFNAGYPSMSPPRNPPIPRLAPGAITLVAALDAFGSAIDPAWTGKEIQANTAPEPSEEDLANRAFARVTREASENPRGEIDDENLPERAILAACAPVATSNLPNGGDGKPPRSLSCGICTRAG
jgi:hypothetical protein